MKWVIVYSFIADGQFINSNLYSKQLEQVSAIAWQKYPALFNRNQGNL